MTILNMTYGQGGSNIKVPLNAISNLSAIKGNRIVTIKWSDPGDLTVNGVLVTSWVSTKLVRKVGSAPVDSSDGTLILTETVADTYSVTGYTDTGLTNGTTYYYGAFAVADNGLETISNISSATPDGTWSPSANTLLYLQLEDSIVDMSGKAGRTLSSSGISYTTVGGATSAHIGTSGYINLTAPNPLASETGIDTSKLTVSFWLYVTTGQTSSRRTILEFTKYNIEDICLILKEDTTKIYTRDSSNAWAGGPDFTANAWQHVVMTVDSSATKIYVNAGTPRIGSGTSSAWGSRPNSYQELQGIMCSRTNDDWLNGNLSELIMEDKIWAAQDIEDYFNANKGKYGIS